MNRIVAILCYASVVINFTLKNAHHQAQSRLGDA